MIRKDIIKEIILGNQDMDLGFVLKKPGDPDLPAVPALVP
jgi:hypothetical protein